MTRDGGAARITELHRTRARRVVRTSTCSHIAYDARWPWWRRLWANMADGRWKSNDPENPNDLIAVKGCLARDGP